MNYPIWPQLVTTLLILALNGCGSDGQSQQQYLSEEVRFQGGDSSTVLAGTLSLPEGRGPFPGVILITGSGAQDRDETLGFHKPFAVLAEALNVQGYAVLRYDDRGTAASTGDFSKATVDDFAADTLAAQELLLADSRIIPDCLITVGHSEGGYVAPLAAQTIMPQAIVLLAGAAKTMNDVLLMQLTSLQFPEEDPERIEQILDNINAIVAATNDDILAAAAINQLLVDIGIDEEERTQLVNMFASPWWRRYLSFTPADYLADLDIPVLALYGDKDVQVRADDNAGLMGFLLHHPQSRVEVLENMNHLFQTAGSGLPDEYLVLPMVFEEPMRAVVINWLAKALPEQCRQP